MNHRFQAVAALSLLLGGALFACDSSLQTENAADILAARDGGAGGKGVKVYDDDPDSRELPYHCEEVAECDDADPCTEAACRKHRCDYNFKRIALKPTYIETETPVMDVSISIERAILAIAAGSSGVYLYDISDPTAPELSGQFESQGDALAVETVQGGAYIAEGITGFEGFSIITLNQGPYQEPDSGVVRGLDEIYNVDIGERYGFVSGFSDGFLILDFGELYSPSVVNGFNTAGRVHRIASDTEIAVVADALGGLLIYSFDQPDGADKIATILTEGRLLDADLKGDTVIMAEYGEGFSLVDISTSAEPRRLVDVPTGSPVTSARLLGPQTAVIGEENGRVSIYDVSLNVVSDSRNAEDIWIPVARPIAPVQIASVDLEGELARMDVKQDLIAVALGEAGAAILTTGCVNEEATEEAAEE
jgi:hypothetical protein